MRSEPPRINEIVYSVLKENIAAGRVPYGVTIRETDVARLLEVSRVPVRAALKRLADDRLLTPASGRGFVRPGPAEPARLQRMKFNELRLVVGERDKEDLSQRNWRQRIFKDAELKVGSALVFGTFRISETRFAEHYGVSRTVAREFLSRIDRIGLVTQLANGRWQAGPLKEKEIHEHYVIRRALEPIALRDAAAGLEHGALRAFLARLDSAMAALDEITIEEIIGIEHDLHVDIVQNTPNRPLVDAIRRSQLPLISTHISFVATQSVDTIRETIEDHISILTALHEHKADAAALMLEKHLTRAEETVMQRLSALDPGHLPECPSFMVPVDRA